MTHYIERGDALQAVDVQILYHALRGYAILDGCTASQTASLDTTVASGTVLVNGSVVDVPEQTVTHTAGDTDPRRDVIYVDAAGDLFISEGGASEPDGPAGADVWSADPFAYWIPQPSDFGTFSGTPICEVAIPAGATDYTEADHLRSFVPQAEVFLDTIYSEAEFQLPRFDEQTAAVNSEASLFAITGNGSADEGVYIDMDGNGTVTRVGEDALLSQVQIDTTAKDFEGADLNNAGRIEPTDGFLHSQGNGEFNLGRHTQYADTAGSWEEIARFTLDADQVLDVYYLEAKFKGGGTNASFEVRYYDESAASAIVSTSDRFRATTEAEIESSTAGATIRKEILNSTGAPVSACISEGVNFVSN